MADPFEGYVSVPATNQSSSQQPKDPQQPKASSDPFHDYQSVGPHVAGILQNPAMRGSVQFDLKDFPRFAAGGLPVAGSAAGGVGGTLIGTGLQQLLRLIAPKTFGEAPQSVTDVGSEALENVVGQDVVPSAISKLGTPEGRAAILGSRAFRSKLNPLSGPIRDAINLDKASEFANPTVNSGKDLPEASSMKQLFSKGYSPSAQSLDPQAILKELDKNPEGAYDNISPDTKQNTIDFLRSVDKTPTSNGMFNYLNHRLTFILPEVAAGALSGHAGGGLEAGAAAATGLVLGDKAISTLMSNPNTARLVVAASKGLLPPGSETFASKMILRSLKGVDTIATMPDKSEEKVRIGPEGQLQYPPPGSK